MIELKNITKTFETSSGRVEALDNVSLTVEDGEIYGIIGMSGAGKSTLVRCINMLERPTDGQVIFDGVDLGSLSEKRLREVRRKITMIFQGFNLLMQKTCLKNVCFPLELEGMPKAKAREKALELLDIVGLKEKAKAYPAQLSGGQQQRVAIARALATEPKVLLCDEATSALDPKTTNSILDLVQSINKKTGITVIIITHQMSAVERVCSKVAILEDGRVAEEGTVSEVFSHPKSFAAKRLVFPEGSSEEFLSEQDGSHRYIRVVFNGADATDEPMIAQMALREGIEASISYASTKSIGGKAYGTMLLAVKNENNNLERAVNFLTQSQDVFAQEVTGHDN